MTTIERYDAQGALILQRDISIDVGDRWTADFSSATAGTQVLLVSISSKRARLLQLDAGFNVVMTQLLPLAYERTLPSGIGMRDLHTLWPANRGHARIASVTAAGLSVQQFDVNSGTLTEQRILPLGDVSKLAGELSAEGLSIDRDGIVRVFDFDKTLERDVLRISKPAPPRFNGPIKQRALAGSWFTPSSSGQGLLMELFAFD